MKNLHRNPISFAFVIVTLIFLFFSFFHRWNGNDGNGWEAIIDGDSKGYYAFLPAVVIYNDLSFEFFNAPGNESVKRYYNQRFRVVTKTGSVNKNYTGVALMIAPFFMTGHAIADWLGEPLTGYSWPYMLMVLCSAYFYLITGLYFLLLLLRSYRVPDRHSAVLLVMIAAGTNLMYYTAIHSAMAHVYSFACIAAFAFFSRIYILNHRAGYFVLACLILGLITIVRPVNLIVIAAIPFLAGSLYDLRRAFLNISQRYAAITGGALAFFTMVAIQLTAFKLQTGNWFEWSYGDEGFNFSDPKILQTLFSFKKGFLVYSPFWLLIFPVMIITVFKNRYQGVSFILFFCSAVFVISSWWNWFYGDGFGLRAFIDFYPLFAVPVAFLLSHVSGKIRKLIMYLFLLLVLVISVIQTYQYRYRIIHPDSMNFEKYRYVFLKTGSNFRNVFGADEDIIYHKIEDTPFLQFTYIGGIWKQHNEDLPNGGPADIIKLQGTEFSPTLNVPYRSLINEGTGTYVRVSLSRMETEAGGANEALLVCSIEDTLNNTSYWNGIAINELPSESFNTWKHRKFGFLLPRNSPENSMVKFYIWNPAKGSFEASKFLVSFHRVHLRR